MSVSSGDLPTIGKEFWDILHKGTGHLKPQVITVHGTSTCLMGLCFLEAGDDTDGVEDVKVSAREGITYSLLAGVRDIISNAQVVARYEPNVSIVSSSDSLSSLVGLTNDIWYIERALKNVPNVVGYIRSEESGLNGIVTPVCIRFVQAFVRQRRNFFIPDNLFNGLANYKITF